MCSKYLALTAALLAGASFGQSTALSPGSAARGAPPVAGSCPRPSGNTGTGLYVACGRVNNPDASEFRLRGFNRVHFDQTPSGLALTGANAIRVFYTYQYGGTAARFQSDFTATAAQKIVTVATMSDNGSTATTCNEDPALLASVVAKLTGDQATYTRLNGNGIVNIANEWGPPDSAVWERAYETSVTTLRAAGFTMPLMIDSGRCGQDQAEIVKNAARLLAADPQHNLIFSFHVYGMMESSDAMHSYFSKLAATAKATGAAFVIGEFGQGRNVGPSPVGITADDVIATAEGNGLGWLAWAWDDNNLPNCKSDEHWFSMTTYCASYTGAPTDLTPFGQDILGQLKQLAPSKSTAFR